MKAAKMKDRPDFPLMRQTDIQQIYHMQMPRWLFSDLRYADMSLEAKVTYTFLLNRFQLSRRNGWVNEQGEVFIIFPRKELAKELRICEQRVTAAFRTLTEKKLIWEKRCGRGDANQIYLATVEPEDDPMYTCVPFVAPDACGSRTVESEVLGDDYFEEAQELRFQSGETHGSRPADMAVAEPHDLLSSNNKTRNKEQSHKEVSQSVSGMPGDGQTDDEAELMDILDACELSCFEPETARVFANAIERLFYSASFRIGNAVLPQCRVRSRLHLLNAVILQDAESKLHANLEDRVKNSTAYTMAVIFNCIAESESDLLVDPYLNSLRSPPGGGDGMKRC